MFVIEQLAFAPRTDAPDEKLEELLAALGWSEWTEDEVHADGVVRGAFGANIARLRFNYQAIQGNELEVLQYKDGRRWVPDDRAVVSHIGTHCTESELNEWKRKLLKLGYPIVQEVETHSHTNEFLVKEGRRYHYCIFGTKEVLGTDLKFIVRIQ